MKRFTALLLVSAMVFMMTACSTSDETVSETAAAAETQAGETTEAQADAETQEEAEAQHYKIGISLMELETFQSYVAQGVENYANAHENVEYVLLNANTNSSTQISQVENLIAQDCNAIIISPVDADATQAISDACAEAGVPLIAVSADINSDRTCCVAADNTEAGTKQAELIQELMGSQGNVAVLMGAAGNMNTTGRTDAYHAVLDDVEGMEIIAEQTANWLRSEAISVVENWLQSGMEIDGILANNDEMAIGAAMACADAGITIPIIGVGATEEGLKAVLNDQISGTVVWSGVQQGESAMDCAVKAINGEELESYVYTELPLVTKDEAQEWLDQLYPQTDES